MSQSASPAAFCKYLPWDSDHFGVRIGRVNSSTLTEASVDGILRWVADNAIDCLYLLADSDPLTLRLASGAGFRLVDVRMTFARQLGIECGREASADLRLATVDDLVNLKKIAAEAHRDSRFYLDGMFERERCDHLYRIWIEKSCRDPQFATEVLVADRDSQAVGYISYLVAGSDAEIGLVAIDERYRGMGIGARLVQQALSRMHTLGGTQVTVVTQGANVAAQRLYQRCGFLSDSVRLWYHRWTRELPPYGFK